MSETIEDVDKCPVCGVWDGQLHVTGCSLMPKTSYAAYNRIAVPESAQAVEELADATDFSERKMQHKIYAAKTLEELDVLKQIASAGPGDVIRVPKGYEPGVAFRTFNSGATRDISTEKLDYEGFLSPLVLRRFAEYMHEKRKMPDGSFRSSDNWQKGIPKEEYIKSMLRHQIEVWLLNDGFVPTDEKGNEVDWETALCALLFNVQGLLFEVLKKRFDGTESDSSVSMEPAS